MSSGNADLALSLMFGPEYLWVGSVKDPKILALMAVARNDPYIAWAAVYRKMIENLSGAR